MAKINLKSLTSGKKTSDDMNNYPISDEELIVDRVSDRVHRI